MIRHSDIDNDTLRQHIKDRSIQFGGHIGLKIYGTLDCTSGKRMKRENRVFFGLEKEALEKGFRPCGHCMRDNYQQWISLNK
ncbi:MAG: metal-binding protein [Gammaproteobacteria bacterium]|nr:metal-binding protein [Gammaproteobacteria bacterium]